MDFSLPVFYHDAAIFFEETGNADNDLQIIQVSNKQELYDQLEDMFSENMNGSCLVKGYDLVKLKKDFRKWFRFHKAAGGLVRNDRGEYLFIKRYGIWDLPKGKLKKKEKAEIGAVREVSEETGVTDLTIAGKLPATFHIYPFRGKMILKRTKWYVMETPFDGGLSPQEDEDISEVHWLSPSDARAALRSSYRSLADTLLPFIID
jgi:8-oxo-dGTP pyrophosphatase MutT (NUDIX family)